MFESRISVGATEKLVGWEESHAKTVVWNGIATWRTKKVEQLYKVSAPCLDDNHFKKEGLGT